MEINSLPLHHKYFFGGFALTTVTLLSVMGYLVYTGHRMAASHSPLVDAAMEIRLHATLGHLWFEEISSGDSNENIAEVWIHFDAADWYAEAMLKGGQNEEGKFYPLQQVSMRSTVELIQKKLREFREIAEVRYRDLQTSQPGSEIDQKFDGIFADFMEASDRIETQLQSTIADDLENFLQMSLLLLTLSTLASIAIAYTLYRMASQHRLHLLAIENAHTQIKEQHADLNYLAHFDQLTKLPNRTLFLDRLDQALAHAKRKKSHIALLFIDLNKFKSINDRLGHSAGDQVLTLTAQRLLSSVRADDTVARLAGDEFTIILSDVPTKEQIADAARIVSNNIIREIAVPFAVNSNTAFLTASIGIAIYPNDGQSEDDLLINADRAMFEAKSQHKCNYHFHSQSLNERV